MTRPCAPARPLVFAHRGGSALAPENTMAAFDHGLALGADGIELDVHLSADGVAVIMHDPTLERTTDGHGRLADLTVPELLRVDAGYAFERDSGHPWRGKGCRIPLLREVLARVRDSALLIELKAPGPSLARVVANEVQAAAADDRVLVGSFHQSALDAVREYAPHLRRGADRSAVLDQWSGSREGSADAPGLHSFLVPEFFDGHRIVTAGFVARAHGAGAHVYVWTVDREEDMVRLLTWGVDGLITDRPDVAVPTVHRWWRESGGV